MTIRLSCSALARISSSSASASPISPVWMASCPAFLRSAADERGVPWSSSNFICAEPNRGLCHQDLLRRRLELREYPLPPIRGIRVSVPRDQDKVLLLPPRGAQSVAGCECMRSEERRVG